MFLFNQIKRRLSKIIEIDTPKDGGRPRWIWYNFNYQREYKPSFLQFIKLQIQKVGVSKVSRIETYTARLYSA